MKLSIDCNCKCYLYLSYLYSFCYRTVYEAEVCDGLKDQDLSSALRAFENDEVKSVCTLNFHDFIV